MGRPVRVAAVGDVHVGLDSGPVLGPPARLAEDADVLLLAGDLTRFGTAAEAEVLARELAALGGLPIVAVLGNHDYESDEVDTIAKVVADAGATVLDGDGTTIGVDGVCIGVAGTPGFGGGFVGAAGSEFGEPTMKAFIRRTRDMADALAGALGALTCDIRVALTHYAPVPETLQGERPEIFPFLGSYLLAEAIDRGGADLAIHGHAHRGSRRGRTPCGVPVRNVAQPLLGRPYTVLALDADGLRDER
jgi:Icc-related predicted phosphoesterase